MLNKSYVNLSLIFIVFVGLIFWFGNIELTSDAKYCRPLNRILGVRFFLKSTANEEVNVNLESSTDCEYEFFSGIYNIFVLTGSNQKKLSITCEKINKQLENKKWDQCYFLIGTANLYTARSKISDSNKLVDYLDSQIKFCEGSTNPLSCIAGVYTGVHLAFRNSTGDSRFPVKNNPFWVCGAGGSGQYFLQCKRNIVAYVYDFTSGDIDKAVKYIEESANSYQEKIEVIHTFFSSLAFREEFGIERAQSLCTSFLSKDIQLACVTGYANGLTEVSKLDEIVGKVTSYCLAPIFSYQQRGECLVRSFSDIPNENKINNCLNNSPVGYKNFCNKVEY